MGAWRILGSLLVVVAAGQTASAQKYPLHEAPQVGDCYHTRLTLSLAGEMRVIKADKPVTVKLTATANHDFVERALAVDPRGLLQKVARNYETAAAAITRGDDHSVRDLRPERRLVVAQQYKGQALVYSPNGPLTLEELELTSEHFDTLALPGLLAGKEVAVGETWKVANDVAQALCHFDGLTAQDLTGKLEEVKDRTIRVSVHGTANGIELGALIKITVDANLGFDLTSRRLVSLEWKQKDERDQGPASPATTVETTVSLTRSVVQQPQALSDVALISIPDGFEPPAAMTQLAYHHATKRLFDLVYDRDWEMVGQTEDHVVLRLLDRGDFVAQATITPWESASSGQHLTPEEFRQAMAKTPGWEQGDVVQEGEVPTEGGRWVYRISAPGRMDGQKVIQNFFLVAGAGGEQVIVVFTMAPTLAEKLGSRDLALIQGLDVTAKKPKK